MVGGSELHSFTSDSNMATTAMAAAAIAATPSTVKTSFYACNHHAPFLSSCRPRLSFHHRLSSSPLTLPSLWAPKYSPIHRHCAASASSKVDASTATFHGPCYVLGDNIDTDQIIPAEYLTLVPSKPDEYEKLGSYAFIGLPSAAYSTPFIASGATKTGFPIIIAGANFGCGSSREHAPVALGAAGSRAVIAESYARIFFRNSVATGEIYPVECERVGLWKECTTGDIVTVELGENRLINHTTGKEYKLKPIGDAGPVIEAGGIFAYARKAGMIAAPSN
ncbi:hypothetical protein ZIOFF_014315 [Zingiber officinale]|uniref:3-isopropylmalate dehydratase n=2 Tax=Zingiber officinale TaxID=94328 RepID=A0A8J5HBG3_ZINOF|nr:hypothetical protein ZIOFF_014315 [Zingiber officinale]